MSNCGSCGFLTMRATAGNFLEVDAEVRASGHFTRPAMRRENVDWSILPDSADVMCFVRQPILHQLIAAGRESRSAASGSREWWEGVADALGAENECPGWVKWQQGFTPKEHREMLDRAELLRFQAEQDHKRREFEAEQAARQTAREDARDKTMREREDKRDGDAKSRHDDQMDTLRGNHKRELAVLGGAIGFATLIAGIIQAGWAPEPEWLEHPGPWWPF